MTAPEQGGRRLLDRILDPQFSQTWSDMSLPQLRELRSLVEGEEAGVSATRQQLLGRLDIVRAEQTARRQRANQGAGETGAAQEHIPQPRSDAELVQHLSQILAGSQPRSSHGMGRHLGEQGVQVEQRHRQAELAADDVALSNPTALSDERLTEAIARLEQIESEVSTIRRTIHEVSDSLATEIVTRLK